MTADPTTFSESWHRIAGQKTQLRPSVDIRRQRNLAAAQPDDLGPIRGVRHGEPNDIVESPAAQERGLPGGLG